jgi:hypothetical protein
MAAFRGGRTVEPMCGACEELWEYDAAQSVKSQSSRQGKESRVKRSTFRET